jgi:hypothetical protein
MLFYKKHNIIIHFHFLGGASFLTGAAFFSTTGAAFLTGTTFFSATGFTMPLLIAFL